MSEQQQNKLDSYLEKAKELGIEIEIVDPRSIPTKGRRSTPKSEVLLNILENLDEGEAITFQNNEENNKLVSSATTRFKRIYSDEDKFIPPIISKSITSQNKIVIVLRRQFKVKHG